jgi:hypothetical protein
MRHFLARKKTVLLRSEYSGETRKLAGSHAKFAKKKEIKN